MKRLKRQQLSTRALMNTFICLLLSVTPVLSTGFSQAPDSNCHSQLCTDESSPICACTCGFSTCRIFDSACHLHEYNCNHTPDYYYIDDDRRCNSILGEEAESLGDRIGLPQNYQHHQENPDSNKDSYLKNEFQEQALMKEKVQPYGFHPLTQDKERSPGEETEFFDNRRELPLKDHPHKEDSDEYTEKHVEKELQEKTQMNGYVSQYGYDSSNKYKQTNHEEESEILDNLIRLYLKDQHHKKESHEYKHKHSKNELKENPHITEYVPIPGVHFLIQNNPLHLSGRWNKPKFWNGKSQHRPLYGFDLSTQDKFYTNLVEGIRNNFGF